MRNLGTAIFCAAIGFASQALAGMTSASYNLGVSNQFGEQLMGTVDVLANSSDGSVTFTVALAGVPSAAIEFGNYGFGEFTFNVNQNAVTAPTSEWAITTPNSAREHRPQLGATSPFGEFALRQIRSNTNGGPLVFTIWLPEAYRSQAVASNFTFANNDGYVFGAEILGPSGAVRADSHWAGARVNDLRAVPIPAPGAVLLTALGLAVAAIARRVIA